MEKNSSSRQKPSRSPSTRQRPIFPVRSEGDRSSIRASMTNEISPVPPSHFPLPVPESEPEQTPTPSPAPGKGERSRDIGGFFRDGSAQLDFSTEFNRGSRSGGVGYKLIAWSFIAALIDSLLIFALSCAFLVGFSFLVKSEMSSMLQVFGGSIYQIGLMAGALLLCTYMIMLRVFLGFTVGEWACSLRLGNLKQRLNRYYSLRVVARMFLICLTGLVVLPLISLLIGRDLAGLLVRLPLIEVRGA
jgi:hypothetical protein